MARPITLKKDGIQTRNRKLAAKAKKQAAKKMGMEAMSSSDFFRLSSQAYGTNAVMGRNDYHHYYGNHQNFGQMPGTTQFNPSTMMSHHLAATNFGASAFFAGAGSTVATA